MILGKVLKRGLCRLCGCPPVVSLNLALAVWYHSVCGDESGSIIANPRHSRDFSRTSPPLVRLKSGNRAPPLAAGNPEGDGRMRIDPVSNLVCIIDVNLGELRWRCPSLLNRAFNSTPKFTYLPPRERM